MTVAEQETKLMLSGDLWFHFETVLWFVTELTVKMEREKNDLIHYLFRIFENKELLIAMNFNVALQYAIWKVQLKQEGLKMSGT